MTSLGATALARRRSRTAQRRWGYLLWVIAAAVIGIPEITAAASRTLPFTTISGMTGHLERHHNWVELIVVALIVLVVFSITRVSPHRHSGVSTGSPSEQAPTSHLRRTAGGRLTLRPDATTQTAKDFDDDGAPLLFGVAAFISLAGIAVATWAATRWWDDPHHYRPAYVLYGLLGLLWIVVPCLLGLFKGLDMPFPTLFRTIRNLETWLQGRTWRHRLGPALAFLTAYLIYAGLSILLLHLTLYPYPNITKIINPHG
jgi:hypothetical protein